MADTHYYDDGIDGRERYISRRSGSNTGALILGALLPLAFLAGWISNSFANPQSSGFESGVGGGPDTGTQMQVSPTPEPKVVTATPTATKMPTPTEVKISPTEAEED